MWNINHYNIIYLNQSKFGNLSLDPVYIFAEGHIISRPEQAGWSCVAPQSHHTPDFFSSIAKRHAHSRKSQRGTTQDLPNEWDSRSVVEHLVAHMESLSRPPSTFYK